MALKTVNEESLVAIGDAIRAKTGIGDALEFPNGMVEAVNGIETIVLPEEVYKISGDCPYRFCKNGWTWYVELFKDKLFTENITDASNMFNYSTLTSFPCDINFAKTNCSLSAMFTYCAMKEMPALVGCQPSTLSNIFSGCNYMRYLPEMRDWDFSYIQSNSNASLTYMFQNCYSLREVPEDTLKQIYNKSTGYYTSQLYSTFNNCYTIDEIRGMRFSPDVIITSNCFSNTFVKCSRVKEIVFATQEDGSPDVVKYKNQIIDLTDRVGYIDVSYQHYITGYNSGITEDTRIVTSSDYETLKNHPDAWTSWMKYSRYNHDSAVNTINSLPDTSAYLATAGGTNTIKFRGDAGSETDGGAINTLTEEEIAVATVKGWTVSFS